MNGLIFTESILFFMQTIIQIFRYMQKKNLQIRRKRKKRPGNDLDSLWQA